MPGFDITSFISNFNDGARAYLFYVFVNNPASALGTDQTAYLVKSSSMPAGTVDQATANWQGNVYKVGTTKTYSDWTVNFSVDSRAQIHSDFEAWQTLINDSETNGHGDPGLYLADQRIWMLDGNGQKVKEKILVGAWPTSVGEIALDYSTKDVANFSVTFAYQFLK